jgi:glycolate oxidase
MCTIGGNVAENAAGPSTLKYGSTRDYFLGGQAIIGTGELINFGRRSPKGVAGYDIAALLCGSEGSLAIFTKLILRLVPLPKSSAAAMIFFADEKIALCAVNIILNQGFLPKTLEYIDAICLTALAQHSGMILSPQAKAALIIECDANFVDGADRELDALCALVAAHGMLYADKARDEFSRRDIWRRRASLSEACTRYRGYKLSEDVAVPLGSIADFGEKAKALTSGEHMSMGIFGHAGDGNLHVQIMFDDPSQEQLAQTIRHKVLLLVLSLKGTITAEHGIGLQKKAYLPLEQSPALIELQKRIKAAFDPHYLLNPGKIFD